MIIYVIKEIKRGLRLGMRMEKFILDGLVRVGVCGR